MSQREHSFTVRLSDEEKAALDALAERLQLDKSATVRQALQISLGQTSARTLAAAGQFLPLRGNQPFVVKLEVEK